MTAEQIEEHRERLRLAEQDPASPAATVIMGPYTAITVIGALQLARHHDGMTTRQSRVLGEVIDQMRPLFAPGSPGARIVELGDDPARWL